MDLRLPDDPATTIRPACLGDIDALVEIDAICFPPDIAYPPREISFLLRSPAVHALVAERNGISSGFAALRRFHRDGRLCGELVTIDVVPQFRRMGVGLQLYGELESHLLQDGGCRIELHVSVENAGALAFYQRLGYRSTGRAPKYYPNALDAWRMEKMLR